MEASWDLFITMAFVIMTVYGLLLGRGRIFTIVLSTYVGYVVANEFGETVFNWFTQAASYNNSLGTSFFGAKVITFAVIVFLLTFRSNITIDEDHNIHQTAITAAYGFLAAGLIITTVFSFMGDSELASILGDSSLATMVNKYRDIFIVAPIAVSLVAFFLGRRDRNRY